MNIENPFDELLDCLDDGYEWRTFSNERYAGLVLTWSEQSHGFGELSIAIDKNTGLFIADTEHMSQQTLTSIIAKSAWQLAGLLVEFDK